jgi:hypothetical protein
MTKWSPNRRDHGRTYADEEALLRQRRMLSRIQEFVEAGIEAEPEVVAAQRLPIQR